MKFDTSHKMRALFSTFLPTAVGALLLILNFAANHLLSHGTLLQRASFYVSPLLYLFTIAAAVYWVRGRRRN